MKKWLLLLMSICSLISGFAQDVQNQESQDSQDRNTSKHNEVKLNVFNLVTFKTFDASYEYIINSESAFGASLLINLRSDDSNEDVYYSEKFAITPYIDVTFEHQTWLRIFYQSLCDV